MYSKTIVGTVDQPRLSSYTIHIVQPNGSSPLTKGSVTLSDGSCMLIILDHLSEANNLYRMFVPVGENPSCLHTTVASAAPQLSSQTVPHSLLWQTSTRPCELLPPLTKRIVPSVHTVSFKSVFQSPLTVAALYYAFPHRFLLNIPYITYQLLCQYHI